MPSLHAFTIVFTVAGGLVALVGLLTAARGARSMVRSARLTRVGIPAEGQIVDNQIESRTTMADSDTMIRQNYLVFRPAVHFRTQTGQEITAIAPTASRRSFLAGSTVPMLYDPDQPSQIRLVGQPGGGGGAIAIAFGLVFAAVAIGVIVFVNVSFGGSSSDGSCPRGFPSGTTCTVQSP